MHALTAALALLSGGVGAGFASGRELLHFFARHGSACGAAILCACAALFLLFCRLPAQMERADARSVGALCRHRFGKRLGRCCVLLFALLSCVTAGAMLAACAELTALVLPIRHAYALGLFASLLAGCALAGGGLRALALPGAALCVLLPALLLRLIALPAGEARFEPAAPGLLFALGDGLSYAALNASLLLGATPALLSLSKAQRRRAALGFCLLFGALAALGTAVCRRHLPAVSDQPLPFVVLSRALGQGGYLLVAACLYAAALSTLCAMLLGLSRLLPLPEAPALLCGAALCLLFSQAGFCSLVESAYPALGMVCAGLLGLLCLP